MVQTRLLFVVPNMEAGGVECGIFELCLRLLREKDFEIFLLTSGGKLSQRLESLGLQVIKAKVKSKNPFVIFKNIFFIKRIIKKYQINLVEVESRAPAWSVYYACKKLKVSFITTIHGAYSLGSKNAVLRYFKVLYNSVMFKSNKIIVVSNYIRDYCYNNYLSYFKDPQKLELIYRGLDLKKFDLGIVGDNRIIQLKKRLNIPDDKVIITLPGRITPIKGQDYLLKTLPLLKNKNYFCILAGDAAKHPRYRQRLINIINKHNLYDKVRLVNNISDMPALYKLSDIVVCSTLKPEAFGMIAIEAQAMERIFIGTALGGMLETTKDGLTGFLVPPDDVRVFAEVLDRVMTLSTHEKQVLTKTARLNVVDNFSFENMYTKLKKCYNSLLVK